MLWRMIMEGVFTLLGTIIGGLITAGVSYLNNKKELAVKKLEFKLKEKALGASYKSEFRKEQISRYSKFSGSFQLALAQLGEVADICQQNRDYKEQQKLIREIIDHPKFEEAISDLNFEMSWILIVTESNEVSECLFSLENSFDEFQTQIDGIRRKEITEDDKKAVNKSIEKVKELHRSLINLLQKEIKDHLTKLIQPTQNNRG